MCSTIISGCIKGVRALAFEPLIKFIQHFFWSCTSALSTVVGTGDLAEGKKDKSPALKKALAK